MKSILSSFRADLFFIMFPGHICLLVMFLLAGIGLEIQIPKLAFLILIIIDNGHVYTTFIRTALERNVPLKHYLKFLPLFFVTIISLHFIDSALIWKFAFYATIFHYIKQNVGLLSFYQALSTKRVNFDRFVLYALQILAVACVHFREDGIMEYYSSNDLYTSPSPQILTGLSAIFIIVFLLWLAHSARRLLKSNLDTASFSYILSTSLLFSLLTITQIDIQWMLISLIVAHGVPYVFLIRKSLNTTQKQLKYSWYLIVYVLLIFGGAEYFIGTGFISFDKANYSIGESVFAALFLLPLFSHFFMDSIIWKRKAATTNSIIFGKY
ncbi:MAG: hypothetical protein KC478_08720 [Bacteriovoracaceae bacterium]|nr:hypothetical protein [Bacteriovoracaceae bacterium]